MNRKSEGSESSVQFSANRCERMKVAIVLMHFNYGGAEKMVSLLASSLDLDKFDVQVFCVYGHNEGNAMESAIEAHGVPIMHLGKGDGFSFGHVVKMRKMLEAFGADVVHTHLGASVYCSTWAMKHHARLLHTLHSIPEKELGASKRLLMRFLYKTGHAVPVAISQKNRELTAEHYGLPWEKVEMVFNPVDVDLFADKRPKQWSDRTWDFIHVARFNEAKNHKGLIEAVAMLVNRVDGKYKSLHVALVGDGALESEIRELICQRGLDANIKIIGLRDDIPELLHDSRCFILPSIYEGLPMSILEAMAAGLPVIATSVGGVPDLVEDDVTGVLVKPGNSALLAEAMEVALEDPVHMRLLAQAGNAQILQYDSHVVAAAYSDLYEKYGKR